MCISCSSQNNLIPSVGFGKTIIGKKKPKKIDAGIEIKLENNLIKSIVISNQLYRTKDGLKIGSTFDEVKKAYGEAELKTIPLKKGNVVIGEVGKILPYKGIGFLDTNSDKIVDLIIIE